MLAANGAARGDPIVRVIVTPALQVEPAQNLAGNPWHCHGANPAVGQTRDARKLGTHAIPGERALLDVVKFEGGVWIELQVRLAEIGAQRARHVIPGGVEESVTDHFCAGCHAQVSRGVDLEHKFVPVRIDNLETGRRSLVLALYDGERQHRRRGWRSGGDLVGAHRM